MLSLAADHVAAFSIWPHGPSATDGRLRLPLSSRRDRDGATSIPATRSRFGISSTAKTGASARACRPECTRARSRTATTRRWRTRASTSGGIWPRAGSRRARRERATTTSPCSASARWEAAPRTGLRSAARGCSAWSSSTSGTRAAARTIGRASSASRTSRPRTYGWQKRRMRPGSRWNRMPASEWCSRRAASTSDRATARSRLRTTPTRCARATCRSRSSTRPRFAGAGPRGASDDNVHGLFQADSGIVAAERATAALRAAALAFGATLHGNAPVTALRDGRGEITIEAGGQTLSRREAGRRGGRVDAAGARAFRRSHSASR